MARIILSTLMKRSFTFFCVFFKRPNVLKTTRFNYDVSFSILSLILVITSKALSFLGSLF